MIRARMQQRGFALPTILIASVVMMVVLVSAVSATASVRSALDGQYYNRLAREAAESGIARANACLQDSAFVVQWSDTNQLHPNTTCGGGAACTNNDSCFVMNNGNVRTTFDVGLPETSNSSQLVYAHGRVELLRGSNGGVWRTYTYSASGRVGIDVSFNTVAFGYSRADGAFFATIAADGVMRAAGYNGGGQLGNGTTASTLTPTPFMLNGTDRATAIFTNFMSQGFQMFAITDKGTVYGAGENDAGQLGNGTTTATQSTPVQFSLPAGVKATNVALNGHATFVTGDNNKVYAVGVCSNGLLGITYTISGCSNRSTYGTVALPTPTSDPDTLPTNNFVSDAYTAYVRMQGGRIYGWGRNNYGQLANGTKNDTATPIKIGTYGDTGQPNAAQIAFDGDTIYVVGDDGSIRAAGRNTFGELGGDGVPIYLASANKCLDNKNQDGLTLQLYTCNGTGAQKYTFRSDGSIYNANTDKCVDNKNGDGVNLRLWTCNGFNAQKFVMRDDGMIYNANTNKCFDNNAWDNVTIDLYACVAGAGNETFSLNEVSNFVDFKLPAGAGKAVKVTTDQGFTSVLTDSGQVWSAGRNDNGQLGNGTTNYYQPYPVRFILPSGVTAKDIFTTAYYPVALGAAAAANTFVIGSDGKVYGAGTNNYGQLGDGTTTNRTTPVAMTVIDGTSIKAAKVQSGLGRTVILTEGKKVYTVGNNSNGQLGDGTTTNSSTPKANRYTNVLPLAIF